LHHTIIAIIFVLTRLIVTGSTVLPRTIVAASSVLRCIVVGSSVIQRIVVVTINGVGVAISTVDLIGSSGVITFLGDGNVIVVTILLGGSVD
jgi:hypothetical protein